MTTTTTTKTYTQGRLETLDEVQKILDTLIASSEDSYQTNKNTGAGLVAFGQKIALRGVSERLHWIAANASREESIDTNKIVTDVYRITSPHAVGVMECKAIYEPSGVSATAVGMCSADAQQNAVTQLMKKIAE